MHKDRRESKGQGILLLVMKREPKAWVSCLKEFMEFGLRPSNHLIAINPRLDGWKYFAHQSFVFGMDGHHLVELTYVLYRVRLTVIYGEGRLMESPRKFSPLYLACEG